jgi:hypothetical protein
MLGTHVLAGVPFIRCIDRSLNDGAGESSAHKAIYSFAGGQTFHWDAQLESCDEMYGDGSFEGDYVGCGGTDGGYESAALWVTNG